MNVEHGFPAYQFSDGRFVVVTWNSTQPVTGTGRDNFEQVLPASGLESPNVIASIQNQIRTRLQRGEFLNEQPNVLNAIVGKSDKPE
jgi:hypothetical protein